MHWDYCKREIMTMQLGSMYPILSVGSMKQYLNRLHIIQLFIEVILTYLFAPEAVSPE